MPETKIRVPPETKDKLDMLIIKLKKHKRGRVTHADGIEHLFKKVRTQKATIRTHEQTIESLKKEPDKPELEKTQDTEISTATLTHPQQINEEPAPLQTPFMEHPPCPFFTLGEDVIICGKDYDKKGVVHKVPEDVCMQCWQRNKNILVPDKEREENSECLCRYEHAGGFFCMKNPPHAKKLEHGLKSCMVCPDRLTKEKAEQRGLILRTHNYVTCGAKEHRDEKAGLMLYCEKEGGIWVTIEHCKKVKCEHQKTVRTT